MPTCIAGMHRAGTSMVARALEACGVDLGGPGHFAPPAPDNRDGYWEDLRFVALNERILDRFEGAWDHPPGLLAGWEASPALDGERHEAEALVRGRAEPWGWKDPRNSLTAPFWKRLLPGMKVVVCLRNPLEVAASLRARGYTSKRFGLALWETYHRALAETVDGAEGLVTHYESFLTNPRAELDRLLDFLGLPTPRAVREAVLGSASPASRHQRRTSAEVEASALSASGKRLYAELCASSGPVYEQARLQEAVQVLEPVTPGGPAPRDPSELMQALLDAREVELMSIEPVLAARDAELASAKEELASVKGVLAARGKQLASIQPVLAARDAELASAKEELASARGVLAAPGEQLASIQLLLAAMDADLASAKEELASVKGVLAARDEELASIQPVLAARDAELASAKEELASVKGVLVARDAELASIKLAVAAREQELGEQGLLAGPGSAASPDASVSRRKDLP